jgi:hypothetical protein
MDSAMATKNPWFTRWAATITGVALLVVPIGALALKRARDRNPNSPAALLWIPAEDLTLGEVWANDGIQHSIRVCNQSSQTVQIKELTASCQCATLEPRSFTIPSGGTVVVRLLLNLAPDKLDASASVPRVVNVDVLALLETANGKQLRKAWVLNARVRSAFQLSPTEFAMELDYAKSQSTEDLRQLIVLESVIPLRSIQASSEHDLFSATAELVTPSRAIVAVTPVARVPPGRSATRVQIRAVTMSGEQVPVVRVPLKWISRSTIDLVPPEVAFGVCQLGNIESANILVQNRVSSGLEGLQMYCDNPGVDVSEVEAPNGTSGRLFRVTVRVIRPGATTTTVFVRESDGTLNPVPVTYVGITP